MNWAVPDGFKSVTNETLWYNGCYTMTSYIQGNEKVFTKNPMYWDTECTRFDTVTYKMIESSDVGYQLYETGEIDAIGLSESQLSTITSDPNHKFYNYLVPATPSKYSLISSTSTSTRRMKTAHQILTGTLLSLTKHSVKQCITVWI